MIPNIIKRNSARSLAFSGILRASLSPSVNSLPSRFSRLQRPTMRTTPLSFSMNQDVYFNAYRAVCLYSGNRRTLVTPTQKQQEEVLAEPPVKKLSLLEKVKHEALHYWNGSKLLAKEVRISSSLLWQLLQGESLSRREKRQLKRTSTDLFRIVPFAVMIIVPFLELLIPLVIKLFPNFLPSTFEDKAANEEKRRRLLKVRLEMAKFLRETISEAAKMKLKNTEAAEEFGNFFKKVRTSGELADTEELLKVASYFEDELTLDNLPRPQLMSICRYMGINTLGTENFLKYLIRNRMREIREDDRLIQAEGVDELTVTELIQACSQRGIRTVGVSPVHLRRELVQWLDLSLNHKVPSTLLILSRAFSLLDKQPKSQVDALQATLSSLPDELVNEVDLKLSEEQGAATTAQKLEVIEEQQEMIHEEREQKEREEAEWKAAEEASEAKPAASSTPTTSAKDTTTATAASETPASPALESKKSDT